MFNVNGTPILENEISVIIELKRQLDLQGVHLFHVIKDVGKDIMTTCPFHKNGQERKPSFGISKDMICHCFACGWSGMLDDVISLCFGYDDCGFYGTQWLTKNFVTVSIEQRKPIELDMVRNKPLEVKQYITEEELDSYRYYHPYMYKRGLTNEIIERFDIGFDSNSNCITVPVTDLNKNVVFIARRSVQGKFFSYPRGSEKPVYCGDRCMECSPQTPIIVTESVFNTLTCWKFGKPSVALFGTGSRSQYEILKRLPAKKLILALDPDDAGERGTKKLIEHLRGHKILTRLQIPSGQDLNDLDEKILELKEIFC